MTDDLSEREAALRRLPMPYSLALRLREAGVAHKVIAEYVGVEDSSLDGFYRIAEQKLTALQQQREPEVDEGIRNAGIG
ncbi:hypothetical protein [Mycobacterium sp. 1245805.9]|uniref:hypothetical protein n=1 Tax=Mycobacterium sp. 1245805.9 TaxID=1856862 RepID=UPI00080046D8|nr:hypothetical protein [Mycobacterium sp. 1245805.9]OBI87847.1 hypothetical protein A9X00_23245 [Mycobacterium sp. 1245805.9]